MPIFSLLIRLENGSKGELRVLKLSLFLLESSGLGLLAISKPYVFGRRNLIFATPGL